MFLDFNDVISKLANRIDAHHEIVEKQFKRFSRKMQQTTVRLAYLLKHHFLNLLIFFLD